jgi:Na+/glutamate symporter
MLGTWYGSATLGLFAGMIAGAVAGLFGRKRGASHAG